MFLEIDFNIFKLYIVKFIKKWYIINNNSSYTGLKIQEREGYAMSKREIINKLDDILENAGVNEILGRKKEKNCNKLLWALAIIGAIAAVAAIVFAVYRYLKPDYLEDFDDDFDDDDLDDDFFEDEDEEDAALDEKKE